MTVSQVPPPDIFQEPLRRLLDEIQDVLEALGTAVEGVRDLRFGTFWSVVQKGPDLGAVLPAKCGYRLVVLLVHRQDIVEAPTIVGRDAARPLKDEVYAP
jgi:hypothetical protein